METLADDFDFDGFISLARSRAEAMDDIVYAPREKSVRGNKPMQREFKKKRSKRIIAYDLETTNIAEGTPDVLYITAFSGGDKPFRLSIPIRGANPAEHQQNFLDVLETHLLIRENNRACFVAWNGNKYDALLVSLSLLLSDEWEIHPYLTKSNSVRGMRLIGRKGTTKEKLQFELLDGMAMTGLDTVGMPLKKFVSMFAPDFAKLEFDFVHQQFNADNSDHVAYAERDAEALWYAMRRVNEIMIELTGNELSATMGNSAIRYLMSKMPEGVQVWRPNEELFDIIHRCAKRGGYVWIDRQYTGPVWKYDLNQAYAGAMRDCSLPCSSVIRAANFYHPDKPGIYLCEIERRERSPIPFYYKDSETGAANFTAGGKVKTWILSIEIEHLRNDDWSVDVQDGYYWDDAFNLKSMVDELERLRFTDPQGPGGPLGIMVKTLGNSAYGKTLERLDGISLVMAKKCPDGLIPYIIDTPVPLPIFADVQEPFAAPYHQPQIGAFVTAHVRLQVRAAALQMSEHFLYADTDCVVFSAPANHLEIDPRRYGAWKEESAGVEYTLIGKKVYFGADGTKHAKGLRIKDLGESDFLNWAKGQPPTQKQLQRVNFLKMIGGEPMFRTLERRGTDVNSLKSVNFDGQKFHSLY